MNDNNVLEAPESIIERIVQTSNKLFAAEEWNVIFSALQNVSINPYDYDTVKRALTDYIKANNPEEYEYYTQHGVLKLHVELFARLSHSLSYRYELSTRENFYSTSEIRDNLVEMAKIFAYQPSRNRAANGQCKVTAVRTSEPVVDGSGRLMTGSTIRWGDTTDDKWYDKFVRIMNAAFSATNPVGRPVERINLGGVRHDLYAIDRLNTSSIAPKFKAKVNNTSYSMEAVSTVLSNEMVSEATPDPYSSFNILHKSDGGGNFSPNTGFFVQFKQGNIEHVDYNFNDPLKNRIIDVDVDNINDTDVWFCEVSKNGTTRYVWEPVDSLTGQNTEYQKSFNRNDRNYVIRTRNNNQISLVFGDDVTSKIPYGTFRLWYRKSENSKYIIRPREIQSIPITIPYKGKDDQTYQITLYLTNEETIENAETEETAESISLNAPLSHYTQERMINGEDYNTYPLISSSLIKKTKTVNRTHVGHSRYMDIYDDNNQISKITMTASDGFIYAETDDFSRSVNISGSDDSIMADMYNNVISLMREQGFKNYFYSVVANEINISSSIIWRTLPSQNVFFNRGYFQVGGNVALVGQESNINELRTLNHKSLLIVNGNVPTYMDYYENNGFVNPSISPMGSIELRDFIQDGSIISSILPYIELDKFVEQDFSSILPSIKNNESFNVYYRAYAGVFTTDDSHYDSVFVQSYSYNGNGNYDVTSPSLSFVIGSESDIQFFYNMSGTNTRDPITNEIVQDYITVGAGNVSLGMEDDNATFLMKRDKTKDITMFKRHGDI